MELYLTNTGCINFSTMAKLSRSCESRFRQNFKNSFDWSLSNKSFLQPTNGRRIAIAIALCFISKSGKNTPGMDWFWSVCAAKMNKGLEILGISIVDVVVKDALFLKAEQTFTDLISHSRDDVNSKYLYCGPKSGKKGRFQKSFCKFGIYNFDINAFRGDYRTDRKILILPLSIRNPCCTMLQWWIDLLHCPENLRICD